MNNPVGGDLIYSHDYADEKEMKVKKNMFKYASTVQINTYDCEKFQ